MGNHLSRTRRDTDLWERMVNSQFGGEQPVLSGDESIMAARKLWRHAMGKPFNGRIKLTSGNRRTWTRQGVLYVNPDERRRNSRGLREIIHSISHLAHYRLHPGDKPHSIRQARMEAKLAKFALDRRWHEGALKREPAIEKTKPDAVAQRYARMVARRDKWAREFGRAKRLLAKAESEVRTYERRHGDRLAA